MSSYSCVLRQRHLNEVLNELVIKRITTTVQSVHVQPARIVHLRPLQENHSRVLLLFRPHAIGAMTVCQYVHRQALSYRCNSLACLSIRLGQALEVATGHRVLEQVDVDSTGHSDNCINVVFAFVLVREHARGAVHNRAKPCTMGESPLVLGAARIR